MLQTIQSALRKKALRRSLAIVIMIATVIVFVLFFARHPDYLLDLRHISPWVIVEVVLLNALLIFVLTFTYNYTLMLCGKKLAFKENFMLTAYSSIANFFGPLQSGPGVRAVYLKTRHQVRLRDYTLATLVQYGMFASMSAILLFAGSLVWWETSLIFLGVAGFSVTVIKLYIAHGKRKNKPTMLHWSPQAISGLLLSTLAMVVIVTTYYFIELRAVNAHISLHQAIIYSGAANFALFVSITPDAVGIRESFLVLARRLNHIPTAVILSANLIDRGAYLIFLVLLGIFVLSIHARDKLKLGQLRQEDSLGQSQ